MELHAHHYSAITSRMHQMKCFPGDRIQEGVSIAPGGLHQCAGCGIRITDRYMLHALERFWHSNCLKCSSCGSILAEMGGSCYSKNQMILCKNDYTRLFGSSGACAGCGQTIPPTDLVTRAGGAVFHIKCFTCTKCCTQLHPGDRYYLMSGQPVCEMDWQKAVKAASLAAASAGAGNGGAPVRKGKVGRPRRSRE